MTPANGTEQDLSSDARPNGEAARRGCRSPAETPHRRTKEERRPGPDLGHIRAGATLIAVLGLLALLHFAASVFITLFSAMLLAFALEPLVHLLCVRTPLRRPHASGIVVFLFVAMLYGLFYATYLRAESFFAEIPAIAEKIRSAPMVASIANRAEELNRVVAEAGQRIVPPAASSARPKSPPSVVVQDAESFTGTLLQGLGSLGGVLFALGFIPFLVYFILADREPLTRRTRELFPEEHRATVGEILLDIEWMMRKFLLGNAVIALILSAATVLVFLLLGLPYAVVLGILSGTLSIVPYLGLPLALLPGRRRRPRLLRVGGALPGPGRLGDRAPHRGGELPHAEACGRGGAAERDRLDGRPALLRLAVGGDGAGAGDPDPGRPEMHLRQRPVHAADRDVPRGVTGRQRKKPGGIAPPGFGPAAAPRSAASSPYFFDLSISCWRRMRRRSFPTAVRGIASMNSISRGSL